MPDLHVRPTHADALAVLRGHTALAHRRLEGRLDLLHVDTEQVRATARRIDAFWAVGEPAVDAWAQRETAMASALDWPRRRRAERQDVKLVERPAAAPVDTATALGWLYVREGSSLGGAVIARHHPDLQLSTFTPYAEGPGPMWRRYLDVLQTWATGERALAVAQAAVDTFAGLERAL